MHRLNNVTTMANMVLAHLGNAAGRIRSCAVGRYETGWRSGCSNCVARGLSSKLTHWQGWRVLGHPYPPLSPALPPTQSHLAPKKKKERPRHFITHFLRHLCAPSMMWCWQMVHLLTYPFAKGLCKKTQCTKNYQKHSNSQYKYQQAKFIDWTPTINIKESRGTQTWRLTVEFWGLSSHQMGFLLSITTVVFPFKAKFSLVTEKWVTCHVTLLSQLSTNTGMCLVQSFLS